jgi:hypothetical protein
MLVVETDELRPLRMQYLRIVKSTPLWYFHSIAVTSPTSTEALLTMGSFLVTFDMPSFTSGDVSMNALSMWLGYKR